MEGIVLQAAWHWDRNSNVINDLLGKPGFTPSLWGSMDIDCMISPSFKAYP
jgi:hypothetical protein